MSEPTAADGDTSGAPGPAPGPRRSRRWGLAAALGEPRAVDGALYAAVAATSTPALDRWLRRLSRAADRSQVSLGIAGALALGGARQRRAALVGLGALTVASACANLLGKRLVRRARPDREAARVSVDRHVPMPASASFPSGHTASAVAFATSVGVVMPEAAVPLGVLAGAVGYARVHTGVHYPADVAAGAVLGVASAAAALAVAAAAEVPGLRALRSAAPARSSPRLRVTSRVTGRMTVT
ncbi:phosphatase PAP2 family protein [Streptomyces sp. NPDC059459]|uniref:phosphatase PAP2 family protein n=1 Tax=Streptomyces sp. NPDC059459 TaxID=3346839 RepID=UPI0036B8EBAD